MNLFIRLFISSVITTSTLSTFADFPFFGKATQPLQAGMIRIAPVKPSTWTTNKLGATYYEEKINETTSSILNNMNAVMELKATRRALWQEYLKTMEWLENEPSQADVRFSLETATQTYLFDRYGRLWADGRFVNEDEMDPVFKLEAYYAEVLTRSGYPMRDAGAAIVNKTKYNADRKIYVFRGFEDARWQMHDQLIVRMVEAFNNDKTTWAGATPEQAETIADLSPSLVKAQMLEESYLMPGRKNAAWERDPMQINIPDNWKPWKTDVGLKEPKSRNTGNCEVNIRAGIMFLVRKGFDISGKPARDFPKKRFQGWSVALKRYNGRRDGVTDGREYKSAYAERITRRLHNPDNFVPVMIAVPTKKTFSLW